MTHSCCRSDLTASSGMASTLQQLARSAQWQPSIADHVGLCLERLAEPAEVQYCDSFYK